MVDATTTVSGLNRPTSETTGQLMCVQTGEIQHTGNMVDTDPLLGETGLVDKKRKGEGEDLRPLNKRKRQDLPIQLFMSGPEHEDVLSTHFGHQGFFGQNIDRDGAASGPGRCKEAMVYVLKNDMLVKTCAAMACTSAGMAETLQPLMSYMNPACNNDYCVRCFGYDARIATNLHNPICCPCFKGGAVTYESWMKPLMRAKPYIDRITWRCWSWVHLSCLVENSAQAIKLYTSLAEKLSEQRLNIKGIENLIIGKTNLREGWDNALPDEERHDVCRACLQILTIPQKQGARMCHRCFVARSVPLTKTQHAANRGLYGVCYNGHTRTHWVPTVSLIEGNPAREAILLEADEDIGFCERRVESIRNNVARTKSDIRKLLAENKLALTEHAYTTVHLDEMGDAHTELIQEVLN
jgi:hypothetical protein